jgi:hypothetical protein
MGQFGHPNWEDDTMCNYAHGFFRFYHLSLPTITLQKNTFHMHKLCVLQSHLTYLGLFVLGTHNLLIQIYEPKAYNHLFESQEEILFFPTTQIH